MDDAGQIDLARAVPFRLGPLKVEPALRQVSTTTVNAETLEPRVMQVLVVLATARGEIVSRDDLIRRCWDGRIVGEDSLNRVISRLRRLAEERGEGSFRIETIAKVGYRLIGAVSGPATVPENSASAPPSPSNDIARTARPRSRRVWLAGSGAALAIIAGLAFALKPAPDEPVGPAIVVDTFARSGAVPANYPADLRNEIVANRTRMLTVVTILYGDAARHPTAFHLSGRITTDGATLRVFPLLYAPGSDVPVWAPKYVLPTADAAKPLMGGQLMAILACIVGHTTTIPVGLTRAAMEPWADFCEMNHTEWVDSTHQIDALRKTVTIDPQFADGWRAIATFLGVKAWRAPPTAAIALRAEAQRAVATALRLDPTNPESYSAIAFVTIPSDFAGREAAFKTGIRFSPNRGGQKFHAYGSVLTSVGRVQDTLVADRRAKDLEPYEPTVEWSIAEALATSGEIGQAKAMLDGLDPQQSDHHMADGVRLDIALWTHDWRGARAALTKLPDSVGTRAMRPLIDALEGGDKARATSAGQAFIALATDPAPINGLTLSALALSGRDASAIAAVERFFGERGPFALRYLYQPPFEHIRATPAFAALTKRLGLVEYWRKSGHWPDFCRSANAPDLCTAFK